VEVGGIFLVIDHPEGISMSWLQIAKMPPVCPEWIWKSLSCHVVIRAFIVSDFEIGQRAKQAEVIAVHIGMLLHTVLGSFGICRMG